MLLGLLLAGNLAGFGGTAAPAGGAHKHRPDITVQEAQAQWQATREGRRWTRAAEAWVEQVAPETPAAIPVAAPDAPSDGPSLRLADLLPQLVERTRGTPDGDALVQAMAYEHAERIALMAYLAAQKLRRDDDAAAILLLLN